jgi:hypothetical protein
MAFGVKCLLLARWVQREIAPILYHTVTIGTTSQAESILHAIVRDIHRKEYQVKELIKSFVIRDQADPQFGRFAAVLAQALKTLQRGNYWEHLFIPLPVLAAIEAKGGKYLKLPTSLTYTGSGSMFADYSYENVVRLRVADYNFGLWEIKGMMAIAKRITHLAFKISSNPWAGMSLVHVMAGIPRIECLVVAVDIPAEEEWVSNLLNLKNVTMEHLPPANLSKTLIWKWDNNVDELYHHPDAEMFWKKAKAELA